MKKKIAIQIMPYFLMTSIVLSGCGKKSDCEMPTMHVHKYTKQLQNGIMIQKYLKNEHIKVHGYDWNSDYLEITEKDAELYKKLSSHGLFNGYDNWDYLYYQMASHEDYLEFYYEYTTTETYTTTDSDGNVHTHTKFVKHTGWHTNPNDIDNTGKTRLCHHQYYGYQVILKDGKFQLERSQSVDDVREIIEEYPYFSEDNVTIVHKDFRFSRRELPYLSPSDFDVFEQPDLQNKELSKNKILK